MLQDTVESRRLMAHRVLPGLYEWPAKQQDDDWIDRVRRAEHEAADPEDRDEAWWKAESIYRRNDHRRERLRTWGIFALAPAINVGVVVTLVAMPFVCVVAGGLGIVAGVARGVRRLAR